MSTLSLPRRSSRSHLPSAKSVDCLSGAHNHHNAHIPNGSLSFHMPPRSSFMNHPTLKTPGVVPPRELRDESPAMYRASSFSLNNGQGSCQQLAPQMPNNANPQVMHYASTPPAFNTSKMQIAFSMSVETRWGDTAVLVGSTPCLGEWEPQRGARMSTDEHTYPVWHVQLAHDCDDEHGALEYKVVILRDGGAADWEELPQNRHLRLVAGRDVRVRGMWNDPHTEEETLVNRFSGPSSAKGSANNIATKGSAPVMGVCVHATPTTSEITMQAPSPATTPNHSGAKLNSPPGIQERLPINPQRTPPPGQPAQQQDATPVSGQTGQTYTAFHHAPRPNHSFSIPGAAAQQQRGMAGAAAAGGGGPPGTHLAFDPNRAMALLMSQQAAAGGGGACPGGAQQYATLQSPNALQYVQQQQQQQRQQQQQQQHQSPQQQQHAYNPSAVHVAIPAMPPSGQPVAMLLPDAIPRVGAPLAGIQSMDQSWPPSMSSLVNSDGESFTQ